MHDGSARRSDSTNIYGRSNGKCIEWHIYFYTQAQFLLYLSNYVPSESVENKNLSCQLRSKAWVKEEKFDTTFPSLIYFAESGQCSWWETRAAQSKEKMEIAREQCKHESDDETAHELVLC